MEGVLPPQGDHSIVVSARGKKCWQFHISATDDTIILVHGRKALLRLVPRPAAPPDGKATPQAAPPPEEERPAGRHDHPHLRQTQVQAQEYRARSARRVRADSP